MNMEISKIMNVLGTAELKELQELAAKIAVNAKIEIMKPARTSLVMMGTRDSIEMVPFYLGEVLISQCAVTVNDTIGYGFSMGDDLEKASSLAVIEGALAGGHPCSEEIYNMAIRQSQIIKQNHLLEAALIAKTKVRFDTMEESCDESCN
jgi:alpha-D-ribose 1-methylphosphonate 5-triphosphate synthase subunit PhnG